MRIIDRGARRLVLFAAVCLASSHIPVRGQQQEQSTTSDALETDPAARAQMELVLQALGGRQAWRSIHSAQIHLTISDTDKKPVRRLNLLDDWSTDEVKYRRGVTGNGTSPVAHSASKPWTIQVHGKDQVVREFDQATVLVSQLPGASAEILLRRKEYLLRFRPPNACPATEVCVGVEQKSPDGKHVTTLQVWHISKATNLPLKVVFQLRGPGLPLRTQWETVEYQNFVPFGSIFYSPQAKVRRPDGTVQLFAYDEPVFNVAYDSAAAE